MTKKHDSPEQLADELRQLLRSAGAQSRDLKSTTDETRKAEETLAQIVSLPPVENGESFVRPAAKRRWPRLVLAGAIAAAIAIAFVVFQPGTKGDKAVARTPAMLKFQYADNSGEPISDKSARSAFNSLAQHAADQPDQPDQATSPIQLSVRDAWFLSTDEGKLGKGGASVLLPTVSEQYTFPSGIIRTIERHGHPLNEAGQVTGTQGSWSRLPAVSDETFDGGDTGPHYPDALSTIPEKLASQLIENEAECAKIRAFCLGNAITQLHYNYVLRPAIAAALWQVLADEPSISYLGRSQDRLGRKAVAFSMTGSDNSRRMILFADPERGALLGSEEVLVKDSEELGLTAPAVTEFTALVESRRIAKDDVPDNSKTNRS